MSARTAARRAGQDPRTPLPAAGAQPPSAAGHGTPTGPASVDLLSPWVHDGLRVRALRFRFAWACAATAALVGAAWTGQQLRLAEARADLRGEEAVGTSLERSIDDLAPVERYVAAVRAQGGLVGAAMFTEIEFSRVLRTLAEVRPRGTDLDSVSLTLPAPGVPAADGSTAPAATPAGGGTLPATPVLPPAGTDTAGATGATDAAPLDAVVLGRGIVAACPGPDPFATLPVVGCVTLSGTAPDRRVVAELVRRLDREELFVEPFVSTTTTADDEPVTFSGSVGLTPLVFSGRYDALLLDLFGEGSR